MTCCGRDNLAVKTGYAGNADISVRVIQTACSAVGCAADSVDRRQIAGYLAGKSAVECECQRCCHQPFHSSVQQRYLEEIAASYRRIAHPYHASRCSSKARQFRYYALHNVFGAQRIVIQLNCVRCIIADRGINCESTVVFILFRKLGFDAVELECAAAGQDKCFIVIRRKRVRSAVCEGKYFQFSVFCYPSKPARANRTIAYDIAQFCFALPSRHLRDLHFRIWKRNIAQRYSSRGTCRPKHTADRGRVRRFIVDVCCFELAAQRVIPEQGDRY